MEPKELIGWIAKWNPYCEFVTISTIFAKMRFKRGSNHVINHGPPGSGKSRSVLELIKELDLGTEIIMDNTTTDRGLFETFMNYPNQDIILDECSTLLKSPKTQDMVKLAMEGKPLTWTKSGYTETTDPYKGNIIVNANVEIADTVVDRTLTNKVVMNKEMSLSFNEMYIQEYMQATDFTPFISYLRKIIEDEKAPTLTKEEIQTILEFTQSHIKSLERKDGFSRRIIIRELSYFQHAKKLFGSLNKTVMDYIKPYAVIYIMNAQTPGLIESILGNGEIEKAELVKRMSQEGGYSEQHARKLVNQDLDDKKIVLRGKMIRMNK